MHAILLDFGIFLLLRHFYATQFAQLLDCFHIRKSITLHQKRNGITSFTAAKAFECACLRKHIERGRLFRMERATTYIARPTFLQLHRLADECHQIRSLQYAVFYIVWYHSYQICK